MKDTGKLKEAISNRLLKGGRIGITTHIAPDGDGFCAALGLQALFKTKGIASEIVIDDTNLERFSFLMADANLVKYTSGSVYDLLLVLDCNSYSRVGEREELLRQARQVIVIDHHVPENGVIEADYSHVDIHSVSAGAILFRMYKDDLAELSEDTRIHICNCFYTTILNDTNNFTNSNTNAETFLLASELTSMGVDAHDLHRKYFLNHSPYEMRYVGETLAGIRLYHSDRILIMHSTLEMQQRNMIKPDSIMSVTRWVQGVKGVDVIAYLREDAEGSFKLSLRSPVLDVNRIAVAYGGGGHKQASGANLKGDLARLEKELLATLEEALRQYDSAK